VEPAPGVSASERDLVLLVQRIADGEQEALDRLYDATSSAVHGLARRILRDGAAAEDVTVEVYTQAFEQAWRYDADRDTPLAWLLTMARSRALSRLRRDALRATRELSIDAGPDLAAPGEGPDERSAAWDARRMVLAALNALSAEQRRAIEMAYYLGLSHREIAERLGQPLGTVKTHIRRGMVLLRDHLG
jgi:RNA polymerase sigma-70 factor (ECF subfamily)